MLTETEQSCMVEIEHLLNARNELLNIADVFTIANNLSKRTAFTREQILNVWRDFLIRGREMGMLDTILAISMHQMSGMNKIIELARKGMDEIEQAGETQDEEVIDIALLQQVKKLEALTEMIGEDNVRRKTGTNPKT